MPKTSRKGAITRVFGRSLVVLNNSSASTVIVDNVILNPSQFPGKLVSMAAIFQYYRFVKVAVECHPTMLTGVGSAGVDFGFVAQVLGTAPANRAAVVDLPWSRTYETGFGLTQWETVPRIFPVPLKKVSGQLPWYQTQIGTFDANFQDQGTFYFEYSHSTLQSVTLNLYFNYVVEFKDFLDTGLPAALPPLASSASQGSLVDCLSDVEDEKTPFPPEPPPKRKTNIRR